MARVLQAGDAAGGCRLACNMQRTTGVGDGCLRKHSPCCIVGGPPGLPYTPAAVWPVRQADNAAVPSCRQACTMRGCRQAFTEHSKKGLRQALRYGDWASTWCSTAQPHKPCISLDASCILKLWWAMRMPGQQHAKEASRQGTNNTRHTIREWGSNKRDKEAPPTERPCAVRMGSLTSKLARGKRCNEPGIISVDPVWCTPGARVQARAEAGTGNAARSGMPRPPLHARCFHFAAQSRWTGARWHWPPSRPLKRRGAGHVW
eukprot:1159268-Pelagomonas_calceolata.AAC.14